MKQHKAIALFSGGLDSILAVKWMQSRGYTVYPLFFRAPYLKADKAIQSAEQNGLELQIVDIQKEHILLLDNPTYGFGKLLNPCIDCHGLMFKKAAELLTVMGADFLISGEVLGQRPKSQRRDALDSVARLSGVKDLIVRPLSQLLLPETKPVREGWVDKDDLLAIHGRSRQAQHDLAERLGIIDYPSPAGGCLLTDRNYCLRLKDLMDNCEMDNNSLELLSQGRHFRLGKGVKLIVGRDEADNLAIEKLIETGIRLQARDVMGPVGLITNSDPDALSLKLALQIFTYYLSKGSGLEYVVLQRYKAGQALGVSEVMQSDKCDKETMKQYHISYD